jgi:hypothetical protein
MLLADAGFGPNKPLKVEVLTRQLPASWTSAHS